MFKELLKSSRLAARQRASIFIADTGLVSDGDLWRGEFQIDGGKKITIWVFLPEFFPDELPVIMVDRLQLPRQIPHIEKSGKICLAPSTGILLDKENPEGIIRDSLKIAQNTITEGLAGQRDDDFCKEFLAYWDPTDTYIADCNVNGKTRKIKLLLMEYTDHNWNLLEKWVLTDTLERGQKLIDMMGGTLNKRRTAFFVSLDKSIPTPYFDILTVQETMRIVQDACHLDSWTSLQEWLLQSTVPATVLLSIPNCEGRILAAIQFESPIVHGFRPNKVLTKIVLQSAQHNPIKRIGLERFDASFLIPRGGAMDDLQDKTIAVIGCGSVGSHIIERIASLGVGHFRLVDSELLESLNLYRHALGISYVGRSKSESMCDCICSRYPHIEAQARVRDIRIVLNDEPKFIMDADLVLLALGDETLELRIDELLGMKKPRIHAWVEPLGIGGHVLATGLGNSHGCFRCLFQRAEDGSITNRAAFAMPGQLFQKSMAGCSGIFTPYAGIDADRTAIEAARLAIKILTGKETRNQLVSWYGDPEAFGQAGFHLSKRAQNLFSPGDCKSQIDITDSECPHCGGGAK